MPIDLDHVAIATTDIDAALGTLVGELGGTIFAGGDGYGFRWVQVRLGEGGAGMTVELLIEWNRSRTTSSPASSHATRARPAPPHVQGAGPRRDARARRTAGYQPVSVDLRDPHWKEAFLQPREAHGTVVQLAQVHPTTRGRPSSSPRRK